MAEFFFDYGLFFLKTITVVFSIAALLVLLSMSRREHTQHGLIIEKLNEKYRHMADVVRHAVMEKADWKKIAKQEKKERKEQEKAQKKNAQRDDSTRRKRVFVLEFKGDIRASAVSSLREEISAIASVADEKDEVVVLIENPGGTVHEHGLAASQLQRIRDRGIPLIAIVDKVAASGGYLMACIADKIIAAPFAIVGSIGVLAQIPNFNKLLESHGVEFEQITAGKHKRTLSIFGKNTDEDRAKMREELEEVHTLFKGLVSRYRSELDIEAVATGEHWYGTQAQDKGLVDDIGSSDDYLMNAVEAADVYKVCYKGKQTLLQKIQGAMGSLLESAGIAQRGAL
ncbi:MAG: protease SohB [Gammaproteobacteria bacterium]